MFCNICREGKLVTAKGSEKTNALIAGTDNIKLETIKLLEGTRQHQSASKDKKKKQEKNRDMPVLKSPAGKAWTSLNKAKQVRVKRCMRNTHAIMRHAKPFTDYVWINWYIYAHVSVFLSFEAFWCCHGV